MHGDHSTERKLSITRFRAATGVGATDGKRTLLTWSRLCEVLAAPEERPTITSLPLFKAATFRGDSRAAPTTVLTVDAVCGDYDGGVVSMAEAEARLHAAGVRGCLYTTRRHTPTAPRWRVLAPLSAAITSGDHDGLIDLLNAALGGILAPESWDWSRSYFYGRVRGVEYQFAAVDGMPLDIVALCADFDPIPCGAPRRAVGAPKGAGYSSVPVDDVGRYIVAAGLSRGGDKERIYVDCPRASEHTSPSGPSATAWLVAGTNGYQLGHYDCKHKGHGPISDQEFLDYIGYIAERFPGPEEVVAINETAAALQRASDASRAARFTPSPWHAFVGGAAPTWLVRGVLPRAELVVLYGESGSGKTFFALDLVAAVARGVEWRGRRVKGGRVVYICAEGVGGFKKRVQAYAHAQVVDHDAMQLDVIADAPDLLGPDHKALATAIGSASLIVVDTLAQSTPGANENSGEDMGKALAHCKALHRATGATIVLIHHSGKDAARGARGWSGLKGACDAEIEVTRAGDVRSARVSKQKDGEEGEVMPFRLQPLLLGTDDDGDEITSCIVVPADLPPASRPGPKGKVQQLVLTEAHALGGTAARMPERVLIDQAIARLPEPLDDKPDRRREVVRQALGALIESAFLCKEGEEVSIP